MLVIFGRPSVLNARCQSAYRSVPNNENCVEKRASVDSPTPRIWLFSWDSIKITIDFSVVRWHIRPPMAITFHVRSLTFRFTVILNFQSRFKFRRKSRMVYSIRRTYVEKHDSLSHSLLTYLLSCRSVVIPSMGSTKSADLYRADEDQRPHSMINHNHIFGAFNNLLVVCSPSISLSFGNLHTALLQSTYAICVTDISCPNERFTKASSIPFQ